MSCAVFTLLPKGGRRKTISLSPNVSEYVRLEWPLGNCWTVSVPARSGKWLRKYGSRRARSSSSPARISLVWSSKLPVAEAASVILEYLAEPQHLLTCRSATQDQ